MDLSAILDARCRGVTSIQATMAEPVHGALPFELHGGSPWRLVPAPGFTKASLAGTPDAARTIVDCPDAEGWLVANSIVDDWFARFVRMPRIDDMLGALALYATWEAPAPWAFASPLADTLATLRVPERAVTGLRAAHYRDAVAEVVTGLVDMGATALELSFAWSTPRL